MDEDKSPSCKVLDILKEYYGEEHVDLQGDTQQGGTILIHFPKVTVTNESNKSIDISELYVKIYVHDGKLQGTFSMNRTEYTYDQWVSLYLHSHVQSIDRGSLSTFKTPCLGSGPIRNTCLSLNTAFDEGLWGLFAFELDKYVHTESLEGVPYMRLENVLSGQKRMRSIFIDIYRSSPPTYVDDWIIDTLMDEFLPYMIEKRAFAIGFRNGCYCIADLPYKAVIRISNLFIDWYNSMQSTTLQKKLLDGLKVTGGLLECKIINGTIYGISQDDLQIRQEHLDTPILTFKGKDIKLNIIWDPLDTEENITTILDPSIVMYMVNRMMRILNYVHGRDCKNPETGKKPVYI